MILICFLLSHPHSPAWADPRIYPEFPIKNPDNLSPPFVHPPIHECAGAVHVSGFIPEATVEVFAGGSESIGKAIPILGFADIQLTRGLKLGEKITATQTVGNITSGQSPIPVVVTGYPPGGLGKPEVGKDLYECGVIVPVDKLVESVRVHVNENQGEVGRRDAPSCWVPVWTDPLHKGGKVTAIQKACEDVPDKLIKSLESDAVEVKPAPIPPPKPVMEPPIIGNNAVTLSGLLVGAIVRVFEGGDEVGGGGATGDANWCPLAKPITDASKMTAIQELCGKPSDPSDPVDPVKKLDAPLVLSPICDGAQFVVIRNTVVNATVVVKRNGGIVGYGGAVGGDLILALSAKLAAGDRVRAWQYMGTTLSPSSNEVLVGGKKLEAPFVEILGGEPFFTADPAEQQIDGQVFPRGKGPGPYITVQTCCDQPAQVEILDTNGQSIAEVPMQEQFPGYFTGRWSWTSTTNWSVPGKIPVGEYQVVVKSPCFQEKSAKKFYIIFDPAEVGGPARFSFNKTGIWFYPPPEGNFDYALTYNLHPNDHRVFSRAIKEIKGEVSQYQASKKLNAYVVASLNSVDNHSYFDVIELLEHGNAQCSDMANMLTALLRAIGVPSHPVTGDLAGGQWSFDTWIEALLAGPSGQQWYCLHPHQGGLGPDTRPVAGAGAGNWWVAGRNGVDLVIMAGENWTVAEVTDSDNDVVFTRNTPCKRPAQNFQYQASWLEHLCCPNSYGDAYWPKKHGECSPPADPEVTVSVAKEVYQVGETLKIKVTLKNKTRTDQSGILKVSLARDEPPVKRFPMETFPIAEKNVAVPAGQQQSLEFSYELPRTFNSSHNFVVMAQFLDYSGKAPFRLKNLYEATLKLPRRVKLGEGFSAELLLSNPTRQDIRRLAFKLITPYGVKILRGAATQELAVLKAGERKKFVWGLVAEASSEAAPFAVEIRTYNGGNARVRSGLEIVGPSKVKPGQGVATKPKAIGQALPGRQEIHLTNKQKDCNSCP
jgi:hypothetical protein